MGNGMSAPRDDLLLLLHAAATGPGSLGRLSDALARPGRRITSPDLAVPGPDATDNPADDDIIALSVGISRAALGAFRNGRRFIFGHSMGGLIAVLSALEAGRDGSAIDALILYEPILQDLLDPSIPDDAEALAWDRAILSHLARDVARGEPEAGVSRFVEAWNETRWSALPEQVRRQLIAGADTLVRQTADMSTKKLPPHRLAKLGMPVLLLGGTSSPRFAQLVLERAAASFPDSRYVTLEGAGHMAPINLPDRVAAAIEAWFEERGLD